MASPVSADRIRTILLVGVGAAALAATYSPASAQTAPPVSVSPQPLDTPSAVQAGAPAEQTSSNQTDASPAQESDASADIVVTGIRASLATAINEKRSADNIVDVINAEDVGKLPDQNLAEVLENVTGVQIDRSAGIGSRVSIRGSDQNLVLINGRSTTPAEDARGGISFEDLPAELISSVRVTKVATADQLEGSVGGIVDLRTYRGLGLKEPLRAFRADMEHAENADSFNPRVSAVLGQKFDTGIGEIGVVLSGSYTDQTVREDVLNVRYATRTTVDLNGDGTPDPYLRPNYAQQAFAIRDVANKAVSGSVEWQAADSLKLFAEGTYTDAKFTGNGYGVFLQQPSDTAELPFVNTAKIVDVDYSGYKFKQMVQGTIDGTQIRTENDSPSRSTQSYLVAGGGEWAKGDVVIKAEASRARSDTTDNQFQMVTQYNNPGANFNNANGKVVVPFIYDATGGNLFYGPDTASAGYANITNPNYYSIFIARDNANTFRNIENAGRIDLQWKTGWGPLSSVELGARFNQTSSQRRRTSQATASFPGLSAAALPGLFTLAPDDFFDFTGRTYFDGFVAPIGSLTSDPDAARAALGLALDPTQDQTATFRVKENSYAGYLKLNIDTQIGGIGLRGNAGVRVVHTDQTAAGVALAGGVASNVSADQKYTYALPSVMLTAEPVRSVLLRASYGRSLRRPDFGQLSPTVSFPLIPTYVTSGNPNLKPQTVDQYDAAVEWYFDRNSLLSVGGFYKKFNDLITVVAVPPTLVDPARGFFDPTNCATGIFNPNAVDPSGPVGVCVGINQPVNSVSASLKGLEVAFQHSFTYLPGPLSGLGVIANYTYQDGKRDQFFTVPGFLTSGGAAVQFQLPLRDVSKNNYNITLFYEKYGINARVRYTFRDPFLRTESTDLTNNLPFYQDQRHQVNASVSVDVNPQFAVTMSGINLTKEVNIERAIFADGPYAQERDADRRIVLGVRAKF